MDNLFAGIIKFAAENNISWWDLIFGVFLLIIAWKFVEIIKEALAFFNQRLKIRLEAARNLEADRDKIRLIQQKRANKVARKVTGPKVTKL